MKNSFGATLLFQIVIFFVILFTGYICLSINQAKAFNVKNEVVKAVERYAPNLTGISIDALGFRNDIKKIMEKQGYRLEGNCNNLDWDGLTIYGFNRDGTLCTSTKCAVCIAEVPATIADQDAKYYKVATFYQLDLPIFNLIFNLNTKGETKIIYKR